ncbi:2-phosphosulfolactate phosphatase [Microbacterium sp. ARD32]|uniref:2-phosphosulfolactate phosphatase n=1 Tax=Microbacterium sp. ARD32 TaxID=2962577 RepID=UPI002882C0F6|nr:2-phosphosulfolactate phosphatase [Microbacterium sp. ARD32]MDT0156301.1 2-phosphosulfolactate phosphatase [Microbacterium sp. ARD32]
MPSPFDQSYYQVRVEWGVEGVARLAPADVVVVVDVLRFSSTLANVAAEGRTVELADAREWSSNGAAVAAAAAETGAVVLIGGIRNAAATARAVMTLQERRGARTSVTVIAAGERAATGELRFAVEDHLGAGAVIAALVDLGIDHSSPDGAVAAESFRALRRALRHLLAASGSGRELADGVASTARMAEAGIRPATIEEAAQADAVDAVPVLEDGVFVRFR